MIRTIDLFAGVGGIRLGAEAALKKHGIDSKCVLSSEINEKACETYQLNFGEHPCGEIYTLSLHDALPILKSLRLNRLTFCLVVFRVNRFRTQASEKDLVTLEVRCFLKLSVSFKSTSQKLFFSKM